MRPLNTCCYTSSDTLDTSEQVTTTLTQELDHEEEGNLNEGCAPGDDKYIAIETTNLPSDVGEITI